MPFESAPQAQILEAKYCEGCGAIRLRPAATSLQYCRRCAQRLGELPSSAPAAPRQEGRRP